MLPSRVIGLGWLVQPSPKNKKIYIKIKNKKIKK
jgi:hypothetical protein